MGRRRLIVGASALVLTATLGACSGDDEPSDSAVGSALPSTTSTTARATAPSSQPLVRTTTSAAAVIPGGCPSGVGVAAQSAQQAARCFFQAWEEDNRARAAAFASLDVVDALFRERWSAPVGTFEGCAPNSGTEGQLCTINHRGTSYRFDVRRSEGGWRVTQLRR